MHGLSGPVHGNNGHNVGGIFRNYPQPLTTETIAPRKAYEPVQSNRANCGLSPDFRLL